MQAVEVVSLSSLARKPLSESLGEWERPKAIPGLVADWPLVQAAKISDTALVEYLLQFDVNSTVDALHLPHNQHGRMFYNDNLTGFNFTRSRMPFKQALSQLLALAEQAEPDSLYVGSTTVDTCLPDMLSHNPIGLEAFDPLPTLWIGNKSRIAAHYDAPENLICVTAGKRTVTLFPPDQIENLYVGPLHLTPAGQAISLVDFKQPDFQRFPKFKHALDAALSVELYPGDALYIPSMWWHHVEGEASINMLVNYWWRETPTYLGRPENALYHALISLGQLPDKQRHAWQAIFSHLVFSDDANRFDHIPPHQRGPLDALDDNQLRQFKAWLVNHLKQ